MFQKIEFARANARLIDVRWAYGLEVQTREKEEEKKRNEERKDEILNERFQKMGLK